MYFWIGIVSGIFLIISSFFARKTASLIIYFLTFGPIGYRIPFGLLQKLGLTRKKIPFIRVIKKDIIVFGIFAIAFALLTLDKNLMGYQIAEAIIKIGEIITIAAGLSKFVLGIDVGVQLVRDPDSGSIKDVINYLDYFNININSFVDFERELPGFVKFLPTVTSEEKSCYIETAESDLLLESKDEEEALARILKSGMTINPLFNSKYIMPHSKKEKKRPRTAAKKKNS